jgi:hypothetical protein
MQRCSCFLANRKTISRISIRRTAKSIQVAAALCWVVIIIMSDTYSATSATVAALSSTALKTSKVGRSQRQQQERWLVVDFDGTCTIRDTTPLLPRLAYLIESQNNDNNKDNEHELHAKKYLDLMERLSIFTNLENEYFQRYVEVMGSIESEHTIEDDGNNNNNFLHSQLEYSLDRLDCISSEITEKVNTSKILKGLGSVSYNKLLELIQIYQQKQEKLEEVVDNNDDEVTAIFEGNLRDSLQLHPGCISILQRHATCDMSNNNKNNWRIGILSINWCPTLIEAVVLNPLCDERQLNFEDMPIWCNTVDENGVVSLLVPGAIAKKERILKLQQNQNNNNNLVVYVGDSSTDLLALIQADVGILLMGSKSTIGLALKFGVTIRSLNDYNNHNDDIDNSNNEFNNNNNISTTTTTSTKEEKENNGVDIIWTASDWDEIGSFLNHNDERLH